MDVYLFETHTIAQTNHSLIYLPEMSRLITNNTFYYVRKVKIKQHQTAFHDNKCRLGSSPLKWTSTSCHIKLTTKNRCFSSPSNHQRQTTRTRALDYVWINVQSNFLFLEIFFRSLIEFWALVQIVYKVFHSWTYL